MKKSSAAYGIKQQQSGLSYQLVDANQPVDYVFSTPGLAKTLVSKSVGTPIPLDASIRSHSLDCCL